MRFNSATVDVITDFTVSQTDQLAFDISDIETSGIADVVYADDAVTVADAAAVVVTSVDLSSEYDLANVTADTTVLVAQGDYSASTLQTAVRANLKAAAEFAATDGFLIAYDDGTDSYVAHLDAGAAVEDDADFAAAIVTNVVKLSGVSDATTLVAGNFFAWQA